MATLNIAIDNEADADHKPDVSIASVADIAHGDLVATGTCCECLMVITASYTGLGDDPDDTRWHHVDNVAILMGTAFGGAS